MLILHAALVDGALAVWAEASLEIARVDLPPRGRKRKVAEVPPPPPAGATSEQLLAALKDAGVEPSTKRTLIAWLPAAYGRPVASSPLVGELADAKAATIAPWSVDALLFETAQAIELLATVVGKRLLAPGIVIGADLAFFATAMR